MHIMQDFVLPSFVQSFHFQNTSVTLVYPPALPTLNGSHRFALHIPTLAYFLLPVPHGIMGPSRRLFHLSLSFPAVILSPGLGPSITLPNGIVTRCLRSASLSFWISTYLFRLSSIWNNIYMSSYYSIWTYKSLTYRWFEQFKISDVHIQHVNKRGTKPVPAAASVETPQRQWANTNSLLWMGSMVTMSYGP